MQQKILTTECTDATGLIAKVTTTCFEFGINIVHQDQFASEEDNLKITAFSCFRCSD